MHASGVENGQQAVDLFPLTPPADGTTPFDAIIMDANMRQTTMTGTLKEEERAAACSVTLLVSSAHLFYFSAFVFVLSCLAVLDGLGATRILRSRGYRLPILALTGHALAEDQAAFLQAGADCVMLKPVNRAQLTHALNKYLAKQREDRAAARRETANKQ